MDSLSCRFFLEKDFRARSVLVMLLLIAFVVPDGKHAVNLSRVLIFLPIFVLCFLPSCKAMLSGRFVQLFAVFSGYMMVTVLFGSHYDKFGNFFSRFVCTWAFLFVVYTWHFSLDKKFEDLFSIIVLFGLMSALFQSDFFDSWRYDDLRFGVFKTVNNLSWMAAAAATIALHGVVYRGGFLRGLVFFALLVLLLLCQQRGGYVFFLSASFVLMFSRFSKKTLFVVCCLLFVVCLGFEFSSSGFFEKIISRGDSHRIELWKLGWGAASASRESLLFGYGLGSDASVMMSNGRVVSHYHSFYINTLFFGGLVGLTLFLSMVVYLLLNVWRYKYFNSAWFPVFCGVLTAMLFDGEHVLNNQGGAMFTLLLSMFCLGAQVDKNKIVI